MGLCLAEHKTVTKTIATPLPRSLRDGPTPALGPGACTAPPRALARAGARPLCAPVRAALNNSYQDQNHYKQDHDDFTPIGKSNPERSQRCGFSVKPSRVSNRQRGKCK